MWFFASEGTFFLSFHFLNWYLYWCTLEKCIFISAGIHSRRRISGNIPSVKIVVVLHVLGEIGHLPVLVDVLVLDDILQ